jgi:hypothetical protein
MNKNQNLALAAAIIGTAVPDLQSLIGFLDLAGQKRLATELRKQAKPNLSITGRPHCDPQIWAKGSLRWPWFMTLAH